MSDHDGFEEHEHPALAHSHGHYHVTHNYIERSGGFEHLSSHHVHEHDHGALKHAHYPHENFDQEHEGEAHIHDHEQAVRPATARRAAGTGKAKGSEAKPTAKSAAPAGNGEGRTIRATPRPRNG